MPTFTIPAEVSHDDLMEALEPFFRLLGINANCAYADPPITIGDDITLAVVESDEIRRPEGSVPIVVGEEPHGENARLVTVAVDRG